MKPTDLMIKDWVMVKVLSQIPILMYCTLGLLMIIQGMCKSSQSHSLLKFLRKMGGYILNIVTNINMARILFKVVYLICG